MSAKIKSSAFLSESSHLANHSDEEPSTDIQRSTVIIKNVGILISFLILLLSLFFSWSESRKIVFNSIYILGYCRVLTISSLQRRKISNLLSNFELLSGFFSQMTQPLQQIQCNKDDITNYIKFCRTVHQDSLNPVSIFHLIYPNFTSCRIEIDISNPSKFTLLYFTRYNESFLSSFKFDETVDYNNWNPINPDAFYRYFNESFFGFLNYPNMSQIWVDESDYHGTSEWSRLLTIFSINRENGSIKNMNSLCLDIQYMFDSLNSSNDQLQSQFALLRRETSDTIFTSDLGCSPSLGFVPGTFIPLFPSLSTLNSTFWKIVWLAISEKGYSEAALINTTDKKWKKIIEQSQDFQDDFDGSRFIAVRSRVTSYAGSHFDIITVIKLDETISNYFFAPTVVFVCLLVFLALIYILSRIILKYTIERYRYDKSESVNEIFNSSENFLNSHSELNSIVEYDTSSIWKAINGIRSYQISFPDDINLNKMLDEIVSELTLSKERLFSVSVNKNCQFCSSFVNHHQNFSRNRNSSSNSLLNSLALSTSTSAQKMNKNKKNDKLIEEQTYMIWKILSKQNSINLNKIPDWKIIKKDPVKSLILTYLDVIQRFNLTMPEFDPDLLTQFMIDFSAKNISIHFYTIFLIYYLQKLLSGPFNHWLLQKIDIFILFFVAFTKDINTSKISEYFPNQNQDDEGSLIQKKYLIFNDKYSETERKLEYILSIFYKFIPRLNDQYFEENVRDIFYGIQNFNKNELFSTFHCRIQSPNFNVHSDILDKRLFIKAILCLCSYWPYFSSERLMLKSLKKLNSIIFNDLSQYDEPNFVPSYHYYFTEFFVKPWIELFDQFTPLTDLMNNVENTLSYLKEIEENATNLEVEY